MYYLKESLKYSFQNDLITLNNSIIYFGNDTLNTFNIFDNLKDKKLVFYFSGNACSSCVDIVIKKLQKVFPNYSKNSNILLIGKNINPRIKENYYQKQVLSLKDKSFGLPIEEFDTPFLMVIDENRLSQMVFIPDKGQPELTETYLITIKERFFR